MTLSDHPVLARALALRRGGRMGEAITALQSACVDPKADPRCFGLLGQYLLEIGRVPEAVEAARRAYAGAPDDPRAADLFGNALLLARRPEEALAVFERRAAASPDDPRAILGLCGALHGVGRFEGIEARLARAAELDPRNPMPWHNLGVVLRDTARAHESVTAWSEACRRAPEDAALARELAFTLNYREDAAIAEVDAAHRAVGRLIERSARAVELPARDRDPERQLRVGFLSGDLRTHSVAYFLEPLLKHRDRERFRAWLYSCRPEADETTTRLRGLADGWRDVWSMNDASAAAAIASDKIDVIIDLAGLSPTHRLGIMAHRPAPIRATYLGYPNTTGCASVEYRIVDGVTDPPGAERPGPEELIRIDGCFLCYDVPAVPEPAGESGVPAAHPGVVTLCSFNHIFKLNPWCLSAWAEVLRRVPASRLVLKSRNLGNATAQRNVLGMLPGVDPSRVVFADRVATREGHLRSYLACDLALDTFPYNGTTTTCEALAMGVPVLTMLGSSHASRVGASVLRAAGLPELVAGDRGEFVERAVSLAGDPAALGGLKARVRPALLGSMLTDGVGFARRFEGVLRGLWRRHAGGAA